MPWGRADDGFWHNHKVLELDESLRKGCVALYWLALCWCNEQMTDGRVPSGAIRVLGGDKAESDELVRVGLWEREGKGYQVHDFLVYNRSKDQIVADREERSRVGRLRAEYRWRGGPDASLDASTHAGTHASAMPEPIVPYPVSRTPVSRTPPPVSQGGRDGEGDDAARAYFDVTLRAATGRALSWLNELATDHGEAALCAAIRATDADPPKTFLSRVQVALTPVRAGERPATAKVPKTEDEWFAEQSARREPDRALAAIAAHLAGVES
jgi:hypothetical protein